MFSTSLGEGQCVLFAADLHIKHSFAATLPRVVGDSFAGLLYLREAAEKANAKVIILGGDVFDRNIVQTDLQQLFFRWAHQVHRDLGVEILAFPGNHDIVHSRVSMEDRQSSGFLEEVPQWYDCPWVADVSNQVFKIGGRTCYALPYTDDINSLHQRMEELPEEVDTLFLHQNLRGCGLPSYNCDEDFAPPHVRTIFAGDIHHQLEFKNQHGATCCYPGPMFQQEVGSGQEPGVILFDDNNIKRADLEHRRTFSVTVPDDLSIADLSDILPEPVEPLGDFRDLIRQPIVKMIFNSQRRAEMVEFRRHYADAHLLLSSYTVSESGERVEAEDIGLETLPSTAELLNMYVDALYSANEGDPPEAPRLRSSSRLVQRLLAVGAAGKKASPEERTADGQPLAWSVIIEEELNRVEAEVTNNT